MYKDRNIWEVSFDKSICAEVCFFTLWSKWSEKSAGVASFPKRSQNTENEEQDTSLREALHSSTDFVKRTTVEDVKWAVIYPTLENFNYNFHLPIRHLRSEKKWLATLVISVFTAGLPAKLSRVQLRRRAFRETGPNSLLVSRVANMALLNNTQLSFL